MCARKITDNTFFENNETVSFTECTGIAPRGLTDEAEAEACSRLYSIHEAEDLADNHKNR